MQRVSKIVCRSFHRVIKEGQRLMIIKLENYNSAKELSIEKETPGLWASYDIRTQGRMVKELWQLSIWRERGSRPECGTGPHICGLRLGTSQGLGAMVLWSGRGISKEDC